MHWMSGRLELFDEDPPGFCIRVTQNGRRTGCVLYRVAPRLRRATLGTLPPLTLADARQLARGADGDDARQKLHRGGCLRSPGPPWTR